MKANHLLLSLTAGATLLLACSSSAFSQDAAAAQALARKSDCLKCHAIDKKKSAPSYKEIAAKYEGDAEAESKLFVHLTTTPMVEVDGVEEEHQTLKTKKEADIRNVIQWILSL